MGWIRVMKQFELEGGSLNHHCVFRLLRRIGVNTATGVVVAVSFLVGKPAHAQCPCDPIPALAASRQFSIQQQGDRFNLAILPNGDFRCWGSNCPQRPAGVLPRVVAVAAGYNHALILHVDGTVRQYLGAGSSIPPVPMEASGNDIIAVAAGADHSM